MGNFYLIIVDGIGVGAQEDAAAYNDSGTNTLGHVINQTRCFLPNLGKLGLGNIIPLDTVAPVHYPLAGFGKMREESAGKDSTTGHWEIAGITLDKPFPLYPEGFPDTVIESFCRGTGVDGVLANKPWSGTAVIETFGQEHVQTGLPIVYTSADSVFQVACHDSVVSVERLYQWCEFAREQVLIGRHGVGRVIARPFSGTIGNFYRLTEQRHDYSLRPPYPNLPEFLQKNGIRTYSVGKIIDLFAGTGFNHARKTRHNAEGIAQLLHCMGAAENGFVFCNLIDTDQLYGHRNDPVGFAESLMEFDRALPAILNKIKKNDVLVITGDHGNDPTTPGTDHTREFTPLLVFPAESCTQPALGTRTSFRDIAVSAAHFYGLESPFEGESFLKPTFSGQNP